MSETKGQTTKNHILKEGVLLASVNGLINISIGGLASKANMSRSGLFAHFLSKEQLQLDILNYAGKIFWDTVITPCEQMDKPEEKIYMLQKLWPNWFERTSPAIPGGCIFLIAALEFDDRPGKIKDLLLDIKTQLLNFVSENFEKAQQNGVFNHNMDKDQFAFEFYSLYMGHNTYKKFLGDSRALELYNKAIDSLYTRAGATQSLN